VEVSKLKKDKSFSGRINGEVKLLLEAKGISIQKIVDDYIAKLNLKVQIKKGR
jgi:hypothetical protein